RSANICNRTRDACRSSATSRPKSSVPGTRLECRWASSMCNPVRSLARLTTPANKRNKSRELQKMNLKRSVAILSIAAFVLFAFDSCRKKATRNRLDESHFPSIVLWAWERPEDLRTLDAKRYAVAFLAQTLTLKGDEVAFTPRHQPLDVSPDTKLMAVTRIESQKTTGQRAALSETQKQKLVSLIVNTVGLGNVSAIQIDFDAASSEREFYRSL